MKRKLSTMEHTLLGIVWQLGPCTTYAVMRELHASNSTYYRNRAGTAYPAAQRLLKAGLIRHVSAEKGARQEQALEIAEAGMDVLREWLTPPVSEEEVASTRDLVRLRIYFLGAVPPEQRRALVEDSLEGVRKHLETVEAMVAEHEKSSDPFLALADMGAVYEARARIAWLESILEKV